MSYAILRTAKLTTFGNIVGSSEHNFRERTTENADAKRTHLNKTSGAQSTVAVLAGVKERLATVSKVRKNAVLALEYFIGASPEWFQTATQKQREAYFDDAEKWLKVRHGAENVIAVTRQYDETSPHICAYVVPIDPNGKLNCSHFQDGREKLRVMQTEFAQVVGAKYELERGIEGSTATHKSIKDFYGVINTPTPAPKTKIPNVPEPTFTERAAEAIGVETNHSRAVEELALAKEKRATELKAQRAAEQAKAQAFELERHAHKERGDALAKLRATSVEVRQIALKLVLERLGATPDPADKNNWRTAAGRITVTGAKFFNHDTNTGGGGAIDLVMHLEDFDYKNAVRSLAEEFGTGAVLSQALVTLKTDIEAAAAAPKPPYAPPVPAPEHWPIVRDYLTQVRKISADIVDRLKEKGKLYADKFKNVVFVLRSNEGVELRGTGEKPFHGVRGQKTGFVIRKGNIAIKKVAFVESSIDAISLFELGKFEGEIIAMCGNAPAMAAVLANEYRAKGYTIYAAFDADKAGEAQALALGHSLRLRPTLKDWNADLVASKAPPPPKHQHQQDLHEESKEDQQLHPKIKP